MVEEFQGLEGTKASESDFGEAATPEVQEPPKPEVTTEEVLARVQAIEAGITAKIAQAESKWQSIADQRIARARQETAQQLANERATSQAYMGTLEDAFLEGLEGGKDVLDEGKVTRARELIQQRRYQGQMDEQFQAAQSQQQAWEAQKAYHNQEIYNLIVGAGINPQDPRLNRAKQAFDRGNFDAAYGMVERLADQFKAEKIATPSEPTIETPSEKKMPKEAYKMDISGSSRLGSSDEENYKRYGRGEPCDRKRAFDYAVKQGFLSKDDI